MTLSNNFIFGDVFEVKLNNIALPNVVINKIAFSLTMNFTSWVRRLLQTITGSQNFVLSITKGLTNPSKGPFKYNYYNILFSTADGVYGIDGLLDKKAWIF